MNGMMKKIGHFVFLFVVLVAMTGINVFQFSCPPCGGKYLSIQWLPDKVGDKSCGGHAASNPEAPCRQSRTAPGTMKGIEQGCPYAHCGGKHIFYRINDNFQVEKYVHPVVWEICIEKYTCVENRGAFVRAAEPPVNNTVLIKAPPLEVLCTYLC